jgi:hypothetical protein
MLGPVIAKRHGSEGEPDPTTPIRDRGDGADVAHLPITLLGEGQPGERMRFP